MDLSEVFGEIADQVKNAVEEKGLNLLLDDPKKSSYIPKTRFNEVIDQKNQLKTQVGELAGQLDELKKAASGNEDLTKQIESLQAQNSDWETKYNTALLNSAVKLTAITEQAQDPEDLLKFIDLETCKLDPSGKVKGLDLQIEKLKETKPYLFKQEAPPAPPKSPGANPAGDNSNVKTIKDRYNETVEALRKSPGNQALMQKLFLLKEELRK